MIELDVHLTDEILRSQITALVLNSEKAVDRAFKRAANKTSKWISLHTARGIAKQYGFKVARFRKVRIRVANAMKSSHEKSAHVWIGVNDVDWSFASDKPKQDEQGVWVRDYFFKGAFIGTDEKGEQQVFKRRGAGRLPIDVQKINIREGADVLLDRLTKRAQARYGEILAQEIRYELSKL